MYFVNKDRPLKYMTFRMESDDSEKAEKSIRDIELEKEKAKERQVMHML